MSKIFIANIAYSRILPFHRYKQQVLAAEEIVDLNVGGITFETSKKTLCKQPGSYLEGLLSGRENVGRDRNGRIFIDRDSESFRTILNQGLTEAFRALHQESGAYTFWDYQAGAWDQGHGIRIDHLLLSPQAADRLTACEIDKGPRGKEKASDHTPVWCELTT